MPHTIHKLSYLEPGILYDFLLKKRNVPCRFPLILHTAFISIHRICMNFSSEFRLYLFKVHRGLP